MKTVASITFGIIAAIGFIWAGFAAASAFERQSEVSSFAQIETFTMWTAGPKRVSLKEQSLERLPPRYSTYVANSMTAKATTKRRGSELLLASN